MSGAVLAMPRQQAARRAAMIEDATREPEGALTAEACAMYSAALGTLGHLNALAIKVLRAEHSHQRANLTARLEFIRAQVAAAVEDVYRLAADAPRSGFEHVREAQHALCDEAGALLLPQKGAPS